MGMPFLLCVFDNSELEPFRKNKYDLSVRKEIQPYIFDPRNGVHRRRLVSVERSRLGTDGFLQLSHGSSERNCADSPFVLCRKGVAKARKGSEKQIRKNGKKDGFRRRIK